MTPEGKIQSAAIAFAKSVGVLSLRLVLMPGVARGWPDVLFLPPGGLPLFIEFKAPGKLPTPLQVYRIKVLNELGYAAIVCDTFLKARAAILATLDPTPIHAARCLLYTSPSPRDRQK